MRSTRFRGLTIRGRFRRWMVGPEARRGAGTISGGCAGRTGLFAVSAGRRGAVGDSAWGVSFPTNSPNPGTWVKGIPVWEIMSRDRGPRGGPPLPEGVHVDYLLACPRCGGRLRVLATVQDPRAVQAILAYFAR